MEVFPSQDFMPKELENADSSQDNINQDPEGALIAELSKKGYLLLKENKIAEANEAFNAILELEDNNNYALVGLGDAQRKQNHFREAINYYSQCLVHHVSNNYALFGLADCYKALNQYPKAIEIWEQYLISQNRCI